MPMKSIEIVEVT